MKRHITTLATACAAVFLTVSTASAATITTYSALAPNAFGSPSYAPWVNNVNTALYNGLTSGGTPGTPSYFSTITGPVSIADVLVSGFPTWKGYANPGSVFGPAFANELGTRDASPLKITKGSGPQFSISQLSFSMTSTDPGNTFGFGFAAGSYNYSTDYQGILFGLDGVWGGGDDIFITSGPNTQLVDGLVGRGSANGIAVYDTDPGATQQDKINNALSYYPDPFTITGTWSLGADTASATITVVPVPEPTSMSLAFIGGLSLLAARRRKN